ncbi:alpha/beta hydrolase family protein [Parvularcula sp. LCG005]|uniref:alpha/beta hydrolase family protein n=1 Tax=Parvularcula sp. LCG005 TaxID=3078805 RepID=UPI002943747B|nr:prolyl oligopeptidase family serine peptidase [Parvularcula sp. LCG005]WOI52111.1 prolyl oligopeptidase family serine peptidase [Parvularcula sp. LCG005]
MSVIRQLAFATAAISVMAGQVSAQEEIPLEYFALREVIQNVELSPDGKHLSLMKIQGRDGDPIIEIYETDDLSKDPIRLAADPMEFTSQSWVSDDLLVFSARQRLYKRINGFNQGVFVGRVASYNMKERKFQQFGDNTSLENLLPSQPDTVLISESRTNSSFDQDDPFANFRPRAYYELNLNTGAKKLVFKGNEKIASAQFDSDGNPRNAFGYDAPAKEFVYYGRMPGDSSWEEVYRRDSFDYEDFTPSGFKKDDPSTGYVIATNGYDVYGLWNFDWEKGEFGDLVFRDKAADVGGVRNHPNTWSHPEEVVGFYYYGAKPQWVYFDKEVEALYQSLESNLPDAYNVSIPSMSRDGKKYIVYNTGPHDPGTYYLINNGQAQVIGKHMPLIRSEQLADVEFVEYTARDGRTIRGYITIPAQGEKPYPAVIMPHGGPFVGEMPAYDEWAQMFASRGYLVFQPQFLASRGWGQSQYIDFLGQGGYKMQDDKDDGAQYLIDQGWTEPDRIAMYGWSYGGYASAVAASRTPQMYQCVMPGAAVLDTDLQKKYNQQGAIDASYDFAERRYSGINPIEEIDKINVPMLLIHGDVDQRVPFEHFKRYTKELKGKGKDVQELVLKEADHFYNTLYYRHQIALYTKLIDYLENDCGPGGL